MSTPSEFAATLTQSIYNDVLTKEQSDAAKAAGLVVVYGASDDLMEFEGAIYDELSAYDGTVAYLTPSGLLTNDCENDDCPHYDKLKKLAATIRAIWDGGNGYSWTFETAIPHATFEITEDGDPFCKGIVFRLADATGPTP